jgi:hypothetical protein
MNNKNQNSLSPTEETNLADFKEVIADIAYEAGQAGYKEDNSREAINQIIAWANEFTEAHKNTDWSMTDYLETVYDFTDEKLKTVNLGHKKSGLLDFESEIFSQMCPSTNQVTLPPSFDQHTGKDSVTSEPKTERDSLDEILADMDKCETFGCILIDEISNDDEPPHKTASNLIRAYQNGDCDAMLIALCGWSMESLLDKYNGKRNGDDTDEVCPKCGSSAIRYDLHANLFHCDECGQTWSDKQYVLVEYPEDASYFEQQEIGYPSWESQDNGARYVPQYDYIRQSGKSPDPAHCYRPVCWPDSQRYFEETGPDAHCELIQDEAALEKFGSSALWVPLRMLD